MSQQDQTDVVNPEPLASYELETHYGRLRLEVHPISRFYVMVRLVAPFI